MKKIDKAVEIIRGGSDEDLKTFLVIAQVCPLYFGISMAQINLTRCDQALCHTCWNEEVEEVEEVEE